jgi:transcriptional regulator with XRE-family HTH domain
MSDMDDPSQAAPMPFAATLRAARDRRGRAQAEIAREAGLTPSYLSMLEGGRKPPPTDPVVRRLARALGADEAMLLEIAHLERTPEDIRRRMSSLERSLARERRITRSVLRGPWLEALWHFLSRRGFADASLETLRLSRKTRRIVRDLARDAGRAKSPDAFRERGSGHLEDLSPAAADELIEALPALAGDAPPAEEVASMREVPVVETLAGGVRASAPRWPVPADLWHEEAVLFPAPDQDMYPGIRRGDLVLLVPGREPGSGDVVGVRIGERETLRTYQLRGESAELTALNTSVPPLPPGDGVMVVAVAGLLIRRL